MESIWSSSLWAVFSVKGIFLQNRFIKLQYWSVTSLKSLVQYLWWLIMIGLVFPIFASVFSYALWVMKCFFRGDQCSQISIIYNECINATYESLHPYWYFKDRAARDEFVLCDSSNYCDCVAMQRAFTEKMLYVWFCITENTEADMKSLS